MNQKRIAKSFLFSIAAGVVLIDQLSKSWATNNLSIGLSRPFLPKLIKLSLAKNYGAAFSLFTNTGPFLAVFSLLASLFLFIWLYKSKPFLFWDGLGLALLLGGTLGNGLDRWRLGYVIDFLDFIPINFPIFNCADVSINIAIACFIINIYLSQWK